MKLDNFLFDALHSVCMMYEESQSYHFLHRSFQEYFFADYYSRQDDKTLRKLGEALENNGADRGRLYGFGDMALGMLYDLAPDKVEKFIILPFLEKIWGDDTVDENEKFWRFMYMGYGGFVFIVIKDEYKLQYDMKDYGFHGFNGCVVNSVIFELVCKLNGLRIFADYADPTDEFADESLISEVYVARSDEKAGSKPSIITLPVRMFDDGGIRESKRFKTLLFDEDGNSMIRGYQYRFPFVTVLKGETQNTALIEALSREDGKYMKTYRKVEQYYLQLLQESQQEDDDDF